MNIFSAERLFFGNESKIQKKHGKGNLSTQKSCRFPWRAKYSYLLAFFCRGNGWVLLHGLLTNPLLFDTIHSSKDPRCQMKKNPPGRTWGFFETAMVCLDWKKKQGNTPVPSCGKRDFLFQEEHRSVTILNLHWWNWKVNNWYWPNIHGLDSKLWLWSWFHV